MSYELSVLLRGSFSLLRCSFGECTCLRLSFRASPHASTGSCLIAHLIFSTGELRELKVLGDVVGISAQMRVDKAIVVMGVRI